MDETISSLFGSLFHPDWRESEAQLTGKQVVLLMHNIYMGRWVGGGNVDDSGGCYNFPRSTNKIKSFDEISTSENFFLHFCVVGEAQT